MDALHALSLLAPKRGMRDWRAASFTQYAKRVGLKLEPGQLVIALVAFDGLEPRDLPPGLRELGYRIFGPIETIPAAARKVLALVAGGRGGKSYVFSAHRTIHLALTVDLSSLAPGEHAFGVIVAPNPEQRDQCYKFVRGALEHAALAGHIDGKPGTDSLTLLRADGRRVTIEAIPAKRGGGAIRGRWHTSVALEECAFFQDSNYVVNDQDLFDAAFPRILPGGQLILASTPWAEAGVLYKKFVANHPTPSIAARHLKQTGQPRTAIAAHATTLMLRDDDVNRATVAAQRVDDPLNAEREYDAQFMPLGASQYFSPAAIAACVDDTLQLGRAATDVTRRALAMGIDLGFVRNSAAAGVVERTPDFYSLLDYVELIPEADRLKPSQVFAGFEELAVTYEVTDVVADQNHVEAAREHFTDSGFAFIDLPSGGPGKAEVYDVTWNLMGEGLLKLPNDPRLLEQLREVKKKPLPGGGYKIESPQKPKGSHGDLVSFLTAAIWHLSRSDLPPDPKRVPEPKWERALQELKVDARRTVWDKIGRRLR